MDKISKTLKHRQIKDSFLNKGVKETVLAAVMQTLMPTCLVMASWEFKDDTDPKAESAVELVKNGGYEELREDDKGHAEWER